MAWWKVLDLGGAASAAKVLARWRTEGTRSRKAYRMALRWKRDPEAYDWLELPMASKRARKRFITAAGKKRMDEILKEFRTALSLADVILGGGL